MAEPATAIKIKSKSISLSVWNFSSHLQLVKVAGDFFIRSWYSKWQRIHRNNNEIGGDPHGQFE